ncbi:hypothetical protein NEI07_14250 [Methylocystis sp. NLS-7]|nr:hypothetical protein [Methylocystis suflitae]MCQ4190749.1 hypothetical protein [Methylocystis suflitae]
MLHGSNFPVPGSFLFRFRLALSWPSARRTNLIRNDRQRDTSFAVARRVNFAAQHALHGDAIAIAEALEGFYRVI